MKSGDREMTFWESLREWWVVDAGPTVYGAVIWACALILCAMAISQCHAG